MIKCLLTQLGRAGRENIWLEVMTYKTKRREVGVSWASSSVRTSDHDFEPNIFPYGPPT